MIHTETVRVLLNRRGGGKRAGFPVCWPQSGFWSRFVGAPTMHHHPGTRRPEWLTEFADTTGHTPERAALGGTMAALLAFWHWFQARAIGPGNQSVTSRWQNVDRSAYSETESVLLPGSMARLFNWLRPCSFGDRRTVTNRARSRWVSLRLFCWLDNFSPGGFWLIPQPVACRVNSSLRRTGSAGTYLDDVPPIRVWPRR